MALNRRRMRAQVAHLALYNEALTPLDIRMLFTQVRSRHVHPVLSSAGC